MRTSTFLSVFALLVPGMIASAQHHASATLCDSEVTIVLDSACTDLDHPGHMMHADTGSTYLSGWLRVTGLNRHRARRFQRSIRWTEGTPIRCDSAFIQLLIAATPRNHCLLQVGLSPAGGMQFLPDGSLILTTIFSGRPGPGQR